MTSQDTGELRIEDHPLLGDSPKREATRVVVDGREYWGYIDEPLAMMLLAHGIPGSRTTAHSGSPRGYFCGVGRCQDCLVTVNDEDNVMSCMTPVRPGMIVRTQQGLGNAERER